MDNFLSFAFKIGKMRDIKRKGWLNSGINEVESIADHSFRVAILAMIIGDTLNLDVDKMVKMSLLHDICEIETGDLTPSDKIDTNTKLSMENKGFFKIVDDLDDLQKKTWSNIWEEYVSNKTPEAKLLHQIDKFEMILQAYEYEQKGYSSEVLQKFWDEGIKNIDNSYLLDIMNDLKKIIVKNTEKYNQKL